MCQYREFTIIARNMLLASLVILSVSMQAMADAAATGSSNVSNANNPSRTFNFPGWPAERSSTALSEYSFDESNFGSPYDRDKGTREDNRNNSPAWPNQRQNQGFSQEMPWPHSSSFEHGYQSPHAKWPDNDRSGDTRSSDGKWPNYKWPAWPDDHGPGFNGSDVNGSDANGAGGTENSNIEDTNPDDKWPPKWPHVNRRDEEWPRHSWRDENWPEHKWPEPRWPEDN